MGGSTGMPLRVFMVDPSLFTIPYDVALCNGLANAGAEIHLFGRQLRKGEIVDSDLFSLHAFFYRLSERATPWPTLRKPIKSLEHIVDLARLIFRIRSENPDVVHFQWSAFPVADMFAFKMIRRFCKVILTVHDSEPFNGNPGSRFQLFGYGSLLRSVDGIVVHTTKAKSTLEKRGIPPSRIAVIAHGILGKPVLRSHRPKPGTNDRKRVRFLLFGRLKPYKGIDLLVEALGELPEGTRRGIEARIVGEPFFDLSEIESRVVDLGLTDHVKFELRRVPDEEVGKLIEGADVLIFPYRQIDASGVLYMALNYRKPVIASRIGAFEDLVQDAGNGILVPAGDSASLARVISRIASDPKMLADLEAAAERIDLNRFSWESIGECTIQMYGAHSDKSGASLTRFVERH
jgi:glycosyltransferase involved in cell wall biosynthesis